jgi:hypothetical protein
MMECEACGCDISDRIFEAEDEARQEGYEEGRGWASNAAEELDEIYSENCRLKNEVEGYESIHSKINQLITESSSLEEFADRFELLQMIGVNNIL